jgi:hypothetical protein
MPKCFIRSDRPSEKLALAGTHKILVVPNSPEIPAEKYSEILKYLDKAVRIGTESPFILAQIGFCLTKLRRYNEAVDAYQKAFAARS